jgi:hypothetical protein
MSKVLSMSILAAMFWIPLYCARDVRPRRGLRRAVRWFSIYCAIYVLLILYVVPRLG